jgi:hypothetical protein
VDTTKVQYKLSFPDGREKVLEVRLRTDNLQPVGWLPAKPPQWTELEFHKCPNCPLDERQHPFCPASLNLAKLIDECNDLDLLDTVRLVVTTNDRAVVVSATVQKALGSLIGLLMAISDCPRAAFFRPMARFHLPMATETETIYRAVTTYAMAQFIRRQAGLEGAVDLKGLSDIYAKMGEVDTSLSNRLKAAGKVGAISKSLMEWDVFAEMFPMRAEEVLAEMRPLFGPYLSD